MESALLELETDLNNIELFNTIFRAMHTIKGAAQFVGLDKVSALSHVLEDLLDELRNGKKQANYDIVNLFIQAKDRISTLIADLERSQTEETDVDDLIEKIRFHLHSDIPSNSPQVQGQQPIASDTDSENATPLFEETSTDDLAAFLSDNTEDSFAPLFAENEDDTQISSFLTTDTAEELTSPFLTEESSDALVSSFLTEDNTENLTASFLAEDDSANDLASFLVEENYKEETTSSSVPLPHSSDENEFVLPDEEYDQELFGIFILQLQEKVSQLNGYITRLANENNKLELLKLVTHAVESLRFSANYMAYEQLTHFYEAWLDEISQSEKHMPASFAFMNAYMLRLHKIFPQLRDDIPAATVKDVPLAVQIDRMTAVNQSLQLPTIKPADKNIATFDAAIDKLEATADTEELAFITELIEEQGQNSIEPDVLSPPAELTVDANKAKASESFSASAFAHNRDDTQEEDLFKKLSQALDSTIEQTITSAPINELFGSLLAATKEEQSRVKAQKDKELALEVKTLAEANKESPKPQPPEIVVEKQGVTAPIPPVAPVVQQEQKVGADVKTAVVDSAKKVKPKADTDANDKVFKKSIRVDADKIDSLMNQVGELIVDRAYFFQLASEINQLHQYLREVTGLGQKELKPVRTFAYRFGEAIISLGRTSNELQEGVMKVRMLPISQIFNRYPRLVHDLAHTKGKKVQLEIRGEETELDKMIIEEISDPLIHMIRNAIGHGLETPEVRKQAGKPEVGTLILEAYHESNNIVIEVIDDGKGIDTERIKVKAEEMNLFSREELNRMSKEELTRFIMMPGFSTAKEIDSTSGRGVGMDVVKKNIEKLNGVIEVESKLGVGSKIRLKIPLTLAIIPALLVLVGDDWFTIPLANVEETLRVAEDEISLMEDTEVMYLRGKTLPIFRLATLFNIKSNQAADETDFFVVVVNVGTQKIGLMVDALIGQEEVVIKPLADYLHERNCFSGATIVGDGRISLILDVYELLNMTTNKQIKKHQEQEKKSLGSLQSEM
jgi:two-component system chemotaxis sensor kinase CheA